MLNAKSYDIGTNFGYFCFGLTDIFLLSWQFSSCPKQAMCHSDQLTSTLFQERQR